VGRKSAAVYARKRGSARGKVWESMTVENAMRNQRGMNMARKVGKVLLFFMDLVYPMG